MKKLIRRLKYSEESIYIFSQLGNKRKAVESMRFHEMKIALQVALYIFIAQMVLITLFKFI
jgi:hypothetical protein